MEGDNPYMFKWLGSDRYDGNACNVVCWFLWLRSYAKQWTWVEFEATKGESNVFQEVVYVYSIRFWKP